MGKHPKLFKALIKVLVIVGIVAGCLLVPPLGLLLWFVTFVKALHDGDGEPIREPVSIGACDVSPERLVAGGEPVPVRVTYRVGGEGITTGGCVRLCPGKVLKYEEGAWQLRLQWGNGWGRLQRRDATKANYLDVRASRAGVELSVTMMENAMDRTQLMWLKRKFLQKLGVKLERLDPRDVFLANHKVTVRVESGSLEPGDTIEFVLGEGAGLRPPLAAVSTDFAFEIDSTGNGKYELEKAIAEISATGGTPAGFDVVAPTLAAPGEHIKVMVRCVDSRGVVTPEFVGLVRIVADGAIETPPTVLVVEKGEGVAHFQARVTGLGISRILVRSVEGGLEGSSNPVVCAGTGYKLLWGDLHTHSMVSDGSQEPCYLYHRARDLMGWDFTAVSDHDNWSFGEERARTPEELALMYRVADEYYRPGEFVTFRTYEWTHHVLGHRNVIFGPSETPVFLPMTEPDSDTPDKLLARLAGHDVLVVPHHPAWKTHMGEMHFDFGPRDESVGAGAGLQRLVEVYSRHGNSEFYGCPRPISHVSQMEGAKGKAARLVLGKEYAGPKSRSYVRDALAGGYRFGLTAGSDEHIAGGDPRRAPTQIYGGGITGIFADGLTREATWKALNDRRVCGTTGARMLLEFRVNGVAHGAEIDSDGPLHVTGHVVGTAGIKLAELVKFDSKGYQEVWQDGGNGAESVIDWKDPSFRENSFYYLRVIQEDGHMGWAGPTWVDYTPLGRL